MLGNFSYYNPTKLYFGDESLNFLKDELKGYGPVVLLNYGSVSSLCPHLQQGVRRLPTSNILDVIHECILSRRQHHRRQRPEQNLSIYRCLFFDGYLGIFPSKRIQK